MSIQVEGALEVAADFLEAATTIRPRLAARLRKAGDDIADDYRRDIPDRSGRTRAGVVVEGPNVAFDGIEVEVGNEHFAAGFVEFGGARSGPRPALIPAADKHVPNWERDVADEAGDV